MNFSRSRVAGNYLFTVPRLHLIPRMQRQLVLPIELGCSDGACCGEINRECTRGAMGRRICDIESAGTTMICVLRHCEIPLLRNRGLVITSCSGIHGRQAKCLNG